MSVYSPFFAATLLAAMLGTAPAAQAEPAHDMQRQEQRAERPAPGRFVEGRIAFLRTELKLTEAQQPLFDRLADEMRATAREWESRHAERKSRGKAALPASAVERMELRNARMKAAAETSDRMLAAFKPLYAALSDEQKKTADLLFRHQGGGRFHIRHH